MENFLKTNYIISNPYSFYDTGYIDIAKADALRQKQGLPLQIITGVCNPPVITNHCEACGPKVNLYPNNPPAPWYGSNPPSNCDECTRYIQAP